MKNPIEAGKLSRRKFLKTGAQAGLAASLYANWGCSPDTGPAAGPSGSADRPNIVMLSLDTTRADHMHCYGYDRMTTPYLNELAIESQFYKRALSTSSWTLPAHASMFTGKFVTSHGARKNTEGMMTLDDAFNTDDKFLLYRSDTIRQDETLLAELLSDAGYATSAFVAGPWLKKIFGLHRGFDHHDDDNIAGTGFTEKRLGLEVTNRAVQWLEARDNRPFFMFLNYFDPHTPYVMPTQFQQAFSGSPNPGLHENDQKLYDSGILFMDFAINVFLNKLKELGLYDNTLILAVGDHGELFGEHGKLGHGMHLYQGCLHIPFFVKYPKGEKAPAVHNEFVQVTEVLPLILNRLNLPIPDGVQGSPIEMVSHPILAEVYPTEQETEDGHWQAFVENGYNLLFNSKGNHELYNLLEDPREERNLIVEQADLALEMQAKLFTHMDALPRPVGTPTPITLDSETLQEMEALGYL